MGTPPFAAVLRLFQFSSHWKIKMTSQDFKLSKIQILIKDNDDEEEEEQGPKEVPMSDQTMSILTMIKDQKEKERQQIKDEKIRQMALAQKAKMASKNETRLRLR